MIDTIDDRNRRLEIDNKREREREDENKHVFKVLKHFKRLGW